MSRHIRQKIAQPPFIPMSRKEMDDLDWPELDVLLVSGDAYVDHPSFGTALLGRWLIEHGFRVGIVAQPGWPGHGGQEEGLRSLASMGRPRLFAGVTSGALDSMLSHYTAFRKKRSDDAYTPGGKAGARPNRATIVYTGMVRQVFKDCPVVLGGIEASLRRISHYDFWTDSLRRSLLFDAKADVLVYGMGESALLALALAADKLEATGALSRKEFVLACADIRGTATAMTGSAGDEARRLTAAGKKALLLPSHEDILEHRELLIGATGELEKQVHLGEAYVFQQSGSRYVLLAPPALALDTPSLDMLYSLPYSRLPHPVYTEAIPAWEMIRTSITSHRGCAGGCSFCSLALHQGRRIASRSRESVLAEARLIAQGPQGWPGRSQRGGEKTAAVPKWAGAISDVGGPSANMWQASCTLEMAACRRASCLHPDVCPYFSVDQRKGVALLREVAKQPGVRHVRVASGVRFDLALREQVALTAYTQEFTGGQLKVAPEHCAPEVLYLMRKPGLNVFEDFLEAFRRECRAAGKEQYVVPYLMSAFPGCTDEHMRVLKRWLGQRGWQPEQVQCFIPTPGTMATAMFYAEKNARGEPLYVARTDADRLRQHGILMGSKSGGKGGERLSSPGSGGRRKGFKGRKG